MDSAPLAWNMQGLEQMRQTVVIDLMHQPQQMADFALGKAECPIRYGAVAIDMLKGCLSVLEADRVRFTAHDFWERMAFKPLPDGNWEYRRPS
jgi:hypothetical protein